MPDTVLISPTLKEVSENNKSTFSARFHAEVSKKALPYPKYTYDHDNWLIFFNLKTNTCVLKTTTKNQMKVVILSGLSSFKQNQSNTHLIIRAFSRSLPSL